MGCLERKEPGAKRQRAFDLLKACGEMRLECLEGQCLTDLLERLLGASVHFPRSEGKMMMEKGGEVHLHHHLWPFWMLEMEVDSSS